MTSARGALEAPPADRASRARYRRIMRFAARALAQAWWFELVLPRFGLGRLAARGRIRRLQKLARRFHALAADLGFENVVVKHCSSADCACALLGCCRACGCERFVEFSSKRDR